ncbi:MAG: FecR domain-containing protein [Chitinophagaceae bacterium]|nr:FecR domain-containing protein [Chitinophagaceae bacterium]
MEERIEYLLRQYEKNNCSREELEELFSYINGLRAGDQSLKQAVRNIYDDIKKNHPSFTYVDENGRLVLTEPDDQSVLSDRAIVSGKSKRKLLIIVSVSCLLGLCILIWIVRNNFSVVNYIQKPAADNNPAEIFTTKLQQGHLSLSDGTEAWLNANSIIEVPHKFSNDRREIILNGEAFFNSKSSEANPIIIHCGKITITAYSDSFNIKAYPRDKQLSVSSVSGKIKVSKAAELLGMLTGEQSLKVNKDDENISRKAVSSENVASWRQGNMKYEDDFLIDIIADIERVYGINITLTDAELEHMRVSFSFTKNTTVTQVLDSLCAITNTQLDGENGEFIIL